jgi:SPP1 gp7 family putative phage head morphogenesis protein
VPDSRELKLNEDKTALAGHAFMTVNEIRASRGLAAVEGGDVIATNVAVDPFAPNNADPMQNSMKTIKVPFVKKNTRIIKKTVDDVTDSIASKAVDVLFSSVKDATEIADRRKAFEEEHKVFIARTTRYEERMKLAVLHNDKHQCQTVIRNIQQVVRKDAKAVNKTELLDFDTEVNAVIDFATPLLGELWKDQADTTIGNVNTDATFDFGASSKKLLEASIRRMAKKYTNTTLELLTNQLDEGINAGESIDQLTKRVQTVYGLSEEYRAARVARTETFSVANDAARDAFKQSGVVKSVEWYTAEDELVCEYCGPMDGKIVGVSEGFFAKGETVEGDDGGSMDLNYEAVKNPPLHANCRCEIKAGEISIKAAPVIEVKEEFDPEIKALQGMLGSLNKYG